MKKFTREEFIFTLIGGIVEQESRTYLIEHLYNDISWEEWEDMREWYENESNGYLVMEEDPEKIVVFLNHLKPSTIKKSLNTGKDNGLYLTDEGYLGLFIYDL